MHILAVSPRFAPVDGADTHRLRLLLPHARSAGWSVEVLAVDPQDVPAPKDDRLIQRLPPDVQVHRVRAWPLHGWGLNGLSQRSWIPLWHKGNELLATGRFDLVFFSTTEFPLHSLGAMWSRRHGIPFCMDFQDPWVNDYYRDNPEVVPPGGKVKYFLADRINRMLEPITVASCGGYLSVSERYLDDLIKRYGPTVSSKPSLVRTFPAEPAEFSALATNARTAALVEARKKAWRYVGRGGPDVKRAAMAFFKAWELACAGSEGGLPDIHF
jgi:hypothetical protein